MGKIIAKANQKGGVGKTSSAHNTAVALAKNNKKTLLVDLDPSRNSTTVLGEQLSNSTDGPIPMYQNSIVPVLLEKNFDPRDAIIPARLNGGEEIPNLFLLASDRELAIVEYRLYSKVRRETILQNQLNKIRDDYDYIIIDCPSYLGFFAILALYPADFISIVIRYEGDALSGIKDLFSVMDELKEGQTYDYKILRNGYNATKTTMSNQIDSALHQFTQAGKVYKTIIRQDEELVKAKTARTRTAR